MSRPGARDEPGTSPSAWHSAGPTDLEELLEVATQVALVAGEALLDARASISSADLEHQAERKSSATDLATSADLAAEARAREELARLRPHDAILGEERGASPGRSGLVWVIDPLDGTTNFVYDLSAWSVSVAVAEEAAGEGSASAPGSSGAHGRTLAGVVHDPTRKETFAAALGKGATLDGEVIWCRRATLLAEALVGTGFSYEAARRARQARLLVTVLPKVRDIRRAGSAALDLCGVACGRLDAFYEGGLKPWDAAAGVLVATEAGARAHDLQLEASVTTLLVATPELAGALEGLLVEAAATF